MGVRSLSLVVLVLVSVAAPAVTAGTTETEPAVDVTIRSTDIDDGDTYKAGSDVAISLNASVGAAAADGTDLSEVVVRVNGNLAESIDLNGTNATETVEPELDNGDNTVRVIVTDDAGGVNATAFTVVKDAEAPHVYLTQPYESAPWKPIGDGTTGGTRTTIAGNVIEESTVEKLRITREFDGDRSTQVFRGVGENFSADMVLGYTENETTTNEFKITVTDTFDNVRIYTFEVDVTDEQAPTISLEPVPNETAENRIDISGTVSDDVGIKSGNLTLYGPDGNVTGQATIAAPSRSDSDRFSTSFTEALYTIYPGTYEAEIVATDVTGKTTTSTVTIERISQSERDVAPEVAVDRDRTVVTGPETLFLSGSVFGGVTERLVVETRLVSTGETLDYRVVHSGSRRERIAFDREVSVAENRTEVIVRATDAKGVEHAERFVVDGAARETFVGESGANGGETPWPKVSVEPLRDGRTGTATSAVTVRRGLADTTVAIPESGDSPVAATANVSVDRLELDLVAETNVTATVVARERTETAPSVPVGATPAASVTVQHSVAEGAVDGVRFGLSVRRAYLDAHDIDPSTLSVYRLSGGEWSAIETSVESSNGSYVHYAVDSPGLSVFSLATEPSAGDANGSDANGSDSSIENGTVGNTTADDETATDTSGEAQIVVGNVTVNRTAVAVNESVRVNATLANEGDAEGPYTAGFQTIHGLNVTDVGTERVTVPPGEERTVDFTTQFATEGNHTVVVNGTQAGPVVVGSGGGLFSFLSVLSVLPLRLIGIALGGVLGLVLVIVALRFVLGKVGGDGESASG